MVAELPQRDSEFVAKFANYMRLREESWELLVESIRENDDAKANMSDEKGRAAEELARRIWDYVGQ
jgi:hypothetical protein